MPDVVIADPDATGVIDIDSSGSEVIVSGNRLTVSVNIEPTQVVISGFLMFLRLKVRWNGGTADPTILEAEPSWNWTPGVDTWFYYQGSYSSGEWVLKYTYSGGTPGSSMSFAHVVGSSVGSVFNTGFVYSGGFNYYGIETRDSGGDPVQPTANDESIIVIPYA